MFTWLHTSYWPGITPGAPVLEAQSLSHWVTRKVPPSHFYSLSLSGLWQSSPMSASIWNFLKTLRTVSHNCCCCSVPQLCPVLCDPMDCSTPVFPVLHYLQSLLKLMSVESVMPSNTLILCHPLFFLPSVFLSIIIFSNESALRIRWPK